MTGLCKDCIEHIESQGAAVRGDARHHPLDATLLRLVLEYTEERRIETLNGLAVSLSADEDPTPLSGWDITSIEHAIECLQGVLAAHPREAVPDRM